MNARLGGSRFFFALGVSCALTLSIACDNGGSSSDSVAALGAQTAPLANGVVARVGDAEIGAKLLSEVAATRHISPQAALDLLIEDALFAQGARKNKLDRDLHEQAKIRAVSARRSIEATLQARGPIQPASDADVEAYRAQVWYKVDRGEARSALHALVFDDRNSDTHAVPDSPEGDAKRKALAERIRVALENAKNPYEVEPIAKGVDSGDLQVKVEALPPFVEDGRAFTGAEFDREFTKGAFAVPPGEHLSAVVRSAFGWHVIYVAERMPPIHESLEALRSLTTRANADRTIKASYDGHIEALRKELPVELSTSADADMNAVLATFSR